MKKEKLVDKIIHYLDLLQNEYPDTRISVETPDGTVDCKIGNAVVYANPIDDIIIDAE